MITRHAFPGYEHSPGLPPPMCHVHPGSRAVLPSRGGLAAGGAVVFTGLPSTPGGSSGYGYLGMDITDAASWPRPFNPAPAAYYCFPPAGRK